MSMNAAILISRCKGTAFFQSLQANDSSATIYLTSDMTIID
jgi:hypothetical protein